MPCLTLTPTELDALKLALVIADGEAEVTEPWTRADAVTAAARKRIWRKISKVAARAR
jgi:hypothetical protein